ncbi:HAD family hydrolase [Polluticaenibacter yanchengensis]|uniref:HAD-IA family hydrolase n=1 Tax=Polluticaenibacter yanchengensis TaxID=3014562 RepID=A0ABT4UGD7_9BACT|nr:HAD-IA family hydrolase [Chitinophagaceae bacterium LY-5]
MSVSTSQQKLEKLTNITQGFQAFLYDCDGTLADNMQAHKDSYVEIAKEYGIDLDDNIIDELAGWPTILVATEIGKRYHKDFDAHEFADKKSRLFFDKFIDKTLPIDFVTNHLLAHVGKVKIGVVSGGRAKTVSKTLETLNLLDKIDVLVGAGDTEKGKPAPDPFLLAAQKLNVSPEHCIVFEDGQPGVDGAIAAGMQWVRIDKL